MERINHYKFPRFTILHHFHNQSINSRLRWARSWCVASTVASTRPIAVFLTLSKPVKWDPFTWSRRVPEILHFHPSNTSRFPVGFFTIAWSTTSTLSAGFWDAFLPGKMAHAHRRARAHTVSHTVAYLHMHSRIFLRSLWWRTFIFPIIGSVYSVGHTHVESLRAMGDADTVITTMKFPNNVLATIDISRNSAYGYDQRVEIFGKDGMMR